MGNVNRTYKVNYLRPDGRPKSYIIQAVNTFVFKKPVEVMENIDKVTEYIRSALSPYAGPEDLSL